MLLDKFSARTLHLANRMAMVTLTRTRAMPGHTLNALKAKDCGQRATAGSIVAEGTPPSPDDLAYPCIPGLYDRAQVDAWKPVTAAMHAPDATRQVARSLCS